MKNDNNNGETTLETLARMVKEGFEGMANRFDKVDERLDKVKVELHKIHGIVSTHRLDLDKLMHRVKRLEEKVFPSA